MGLFGNSQSPLESEIEKATSENNTTEKWSLIMDICDKIGSSQVNAKESLKIIMKRLNHADPHVVMQAITLLDACVNNCGKNYHLEIASREFELEFKRLVNKSEPQVANKLKLSLKKWAEGDFKSDPQLNLIPSLYKKMKAEGHDFSEPQATVKREVEKISDPNVVSSQQEEDDIAKAIELSLKDANTPKKSSIASAVASSLYPSMNSLVNNNTSSASASIAAPIQEPRKVRALYDFEAAEDNELTFKAGEVIMVLEESDPNWWRGTNHRGEGFFPANFVTADLSAEPEDFYKKETRKSNKSNDITHEERKPEQPVEINEEAIDRLLFLLHEADPEDPSQDSDEMLRLEHFVTQMGPLIDSELERVDRKHAQLTQLSSDLIDTINLYHSLMRDTEKAPMRMLNNYPPPGLAGRQFYPPNSNPYGMHMGMPDQMSVASAFPSHMTPENFHLMHSQANMHQPTSILQNSSLPPQSEHSMMQQQFPQQPHVSAATNMNMGQMQMPPPSGLYQNNVMGQMSQQQPQDPNRIPNQDMGQNQIPQQQQHQQPTQLSGTTFPQQQNHNLAQNFSLPMQQPPHNMMAPNYSPMSTNQMMQQTNHQPMQINEMMANMQIHSMPSVPPMSYPPQ
ncbi:hypothetical protein PVAND_007359 [Polypedilum vanderplanki]|uniref:Signal transducing adapter molecule 1 n=1 Tax=Polypedilum vanderplanki TaxID=319348 RepID=A0A9J6C6A1_POLVA|nr:hypothetical protein PVAND_007359 [Polypedilum vanderplanki]